jgi:hypothetical protein
MGRIRHWYRPREISLSQTKNAEYQRARKPPFLGRYGEPTFGSKEKEENGGVYMRFCLRLPGTKGDDKTHADIHCLVAQAFIPNDENKPTVDHWKSDDANKTNNRLDNMRFATREEQVANQRPRTRESYAKNRRPVWKLDKTTGKRIKLYESVHEACKAVGGKSPGDIIKVCTGRLLSSGYVLYTYKGFKWAFDDEDVNAREDEMWKRIEPDVLDTKDTYECSTYGRVRHVKGGDKRIVDGRDRPRGIVIFSFPLKNGKTRGINNNVLTAKVFIPNPDNLPVVNHKDGKPSNCHVSNLEWTTHKGNNDHAGANGLCKHPGWTPDEEQYLLTLIAKYPGRIPWSKLKPLPRRTIGAMGLRAGILRKRGLKNRTDM